MELIFFKGLIVFTAIQRFLELFLSKSNERYILKIGGKIIKEKKYLLMVFLHISWLASLIYLTFIEKSFFEFQYFYLFLIVFILGQILRVSAIYSLGRRWSTRIMILPQAPVVSNKLFKLLKHPNYIGVVLEIAALPLMAGFLGHAIFFSVFNFIVLFFRIRLEEKMLNQYNDYSIIFNKGF